MTHDDRQHESSAGSVGDREPTPNDLGTEQRFSVATVLVFVVATLLVLAAMLAIAASVLGQP